MKKLALLAALALAIFTAGALAPASGIAGKGGGIIQSGCAANNPTPFGDGSVQPTNYVPGVLRGLFGIKDAKACGNGDTIPLVGEYCCYNGGSTRLCQYSGWAHGSYHARSIEQWAGYGCAGWINPY